MPVIRWDIGQEVQPDGELQVAGIEIDQVIRPRGRDVMQQFLGEIPMGIDQSDAVTGGDVLNDHVPQQSRLAGTGFPDDIGVMPGILGLEAEQGITAPILALTEDDGVHDCGFSRHSRPCRKFPRRRLGTVGKRNAAPVAGVSMAVGDHWQTLSGASQRGNGG